MLCMLTPAQIKLTSHFEERFVIDSTLCTLYVTSIDCEFSHFIVVVTFNKKTVLSGMFSSFLMGNWSWAPTYFNAMQLKVKALKIVLFENHLPTDRNTVKFNLHIK